MTYTILVNTNASYFKFWSYDIDIGVVHWGRIGTAGQSGRFDSDIIIRRRNQKLNSGYRVFAENVENPRPSTAQVSVGGNSSSIISTRPETRFTAVTELERIESERDNSSPPQRHSSNSEPIKVKDLDRNHSVPNVDSYKTDEKGYLKYRSDYKRSLFDEYSSTLVVRPLSYMVNSNFTPVNENSVHYKKAKEYFNRIPTSSVYNKPEKFEDLRHPSRPTFAVLFSENGRKVEAVAIFGINTNTKVCDFISLKQSTPYRKTILKYILRRIASTTTGQEVTFKIKSAELRKQIKEIAEFNIESRGDTLKYRLSDLQSGIPEPQVKPKRWLN